MYDIFYLPSTISPQVVVPRGHSVGVPRAFSPSMPFPQYPSAFLGYLHTWHFSANTEKYQDISFYKIIDKNIRLPLAM